jgi:hypothetical protein
VTDDELRDLIERAYEITEMQQETGWVYLRDYVTAQIQAKNRHLLNGHAKTIEEYRAEAGWIQGAMFVLEAAQQLNEQVERARILVEEQKAADG